MELKSNYPYLVDQLPYLTGDLPGTGGRIKTFPEDFKVTEIPQYEPQGEGTHCYFEIEKKKLTTRAALRRIAAEAGIKTKDIGVAGYKDSRAISRQRISIEHIKPEALKKLETDDLKIRSLGYHRNKLRTGHLQGNRFEIKIRGIDKNSLSRAKKILDRLKKTGVPNYYCSQRFGRRGDSAALGEALIKQDKKQFVKLYLGKPLPTDLPVEHRARELFDQGDYESPFDFWPFEERNRRNCLAAYKRSKNPGVVINQVPHRLKKLFLSAFQSAIFNRILAERINEIAQIKKGDIAEITESGGCFRVENPAVEQPRVESFKINPTGPIIGKKLLEASGDPGRLEKQIFFLYEIDKIPDWRVEKTRLCGCRRSLRIILNDCHLGEGQDEIGKYLQLSFSLNSGSYATAILRELIKSN